MLFRVDYRIVDVAEEVSLLSFLFEVKPARVRCLVLDSAATDEGACLLDRNINSYSRPWLAELAVNVCTAMRRYCQVTEEEVEFAVCAYDVPAANGKIPPPTARYVVKLQPLSSNSGHPWEGLIPPTSPAYRRGSIHDGTAAELARTRFPIFR